MILFLSLNKLFPGMFSAWNTDGFATLSSLAAAARDFPAAILEPFASFASCLSVTILCTGTDLNSFSHFDYIFPLPRL